jgi:hypothetical protein
MALQLFHSPAAAPLAHLAGPSAPL